jgi:hypothetical protein
MTLFVVAPDESLTNGWKLLEQGPESQSASGACSGGVSADLLFRINIEIDQD